MCTFSYIHHHHLRSCWRDVEHSMRFAYCERATVVPGSVVTYALGGRRRHAADYYPCDTLRHVQIFNRKTTTTATDVDNTTTDTNDINDSSSLPNDHQGHDHGYDYGYGFWAAPPLLPAPPASVVARPDLCPWGECGVSPDCVSGSCRLADLGGRWRCCRCGAGGNTLRCCAARDPAYVDGLCWHAVCPRCRADYDDCTYDDDDSYSYSWRVGGEAGAGAGSGAGARAAAAATVRLAGFDWGGSARDAFSSAGEVMGDGQQGLWNGGQGRQSQDQGQGQEEGQEEGQEKGQEEG